MPSAVVFLLSYLPLYLIYSGQETVLEGNSMKKNIFFSSRFTLAAKPHVADGGIERFIFVAVCFPLLFLIYLKI